MLLQKDFDCGEVIQEMLRALKDYPELTFEFLSIFSPLPDLPLNQLQETLNHVKSRLLLRNLEQHFKQTPMQYRKVLKMILGADMTRPDATRDALLSLLRGKSDLCHQVADFFDRLMVRPEAHEFEFIDMTSSEALPTDGFEEVSFLDKAVVHFIDRNTCISICIEINVEVAVDFSGAVTSLQLSPLRGLRFGVLRVRVVRVTASAKFHNEARAGTGINIVFSSQIKDRYEELIRLMKKADCAAKQAAYREKKPTNLKPLYNCQSIGLAHSRARKLWSEHWSDSCIN
eukprot:sb/3467711/